MTYDNQQKQTANDFIKYVEPILKSKFNMTGEYLIVEGTISNRLASYLDMLCGIDVWYINEAKDGVRGIASRIQHGFDFKTFTIRAKTEYKKRANAIDNNYLYPYYTLQAYIKNDRLKLMALAKTKDVINMIYNKWCDFNFNSVDGNPFYIVKWEDMFKHDKNVVIYTADQSDSP